MSAAETSAVEWTPDRIKVLIAHWEEGLPTSEIGRRLGVTKNAVVGKVHRLGLKKRQSPIRQTSASTAQPKKVKKVVAPTAPAVSQMPSGDVVRLEELTAAMCCWPEGEPGTPEFHFCGKSSVQDKPYCEEHCARAYVKVSKDKRKGMSVVSSQKSSNDTEAA